MVDVIRLEEVDFEVFDKFFDTGKPSGAGKHFKTRDVLQRPYTKSYDPNLIY